MKKIINIFAAAAAMLSLASCEAVIDSVTKNPVFEFAGTTVYDGQSAFLGTAATCKIGWKTDNSDIVYLQYDENGKNCKATFTLNNNLVTDVKITATNLDDATVNPFEGTITVAPWKLVIFQKVDGKWEQVSREDEDNFLWPERKVGGSNNFKVQMQYLKANGSYADIDVVTYKLKLNDKGKHEITWAGDVLSDSQAGESTKCSMEFTLDQAPASTKSVTAKLGTKTHEIKILAK